MHCYLHSNSFELFPYTHGQTKIALEPEHVIISEFPTILTDREQKVFQYHNQTDQIEDMEKIMTTLCQRKTDQVTVVLIAAELELLGAERRQHETVRLQ